MMESNPMNSKHKKAFSMVTAIFVIVIMASISAMIMNVTGKTLKATTSQYQKEQATLLARSYTELAILYVLYYDRNSSSDCLETLSDHFGASSPAGYDVNIALHYIGNDVLLNGCTKTLSPIPSTSGTWAGTIPGFDTTVSLMVDTYISYKDFDDPSNRDITYHRRTLQKL
jgi:type II secretory pathway pseudopilin PulG